MSELDRLRRERETEELRVFIRDLLSSEDWQIRLAAISGILLSRRTSEFFKDAIPALIKGLEDSEPLVRGSVIQALGDIGAGAKEVVDTLIEFIQSASNSEKKDIVYTLGKIGAESAKAGKILINLLRDEDPQLEKAISWALSIIGPDVLDDVKSGAESDNIFVKRGCIKSIGNMGPVASSGIPVLIKLLKDDEPTVRLEAARALGNLRAAPEVVSSISALREVLADDDPDVRWIAAEALRKIGTDEAVKAWEGFESIDTVEARLKQLLNEDKGVRLAAAEALYGIIDKNSKIEWKIIRKGLNDTYYKVPLALCGALSKLAENASPVISDLIELSRDSEISVRVAAITCLGKIGDLSEPDILSIVGYLEDNEKEVRMAAGLALELIGTPIAEKALKKFKWQ
ncbi:MAG TPA: HEAT repeat domain-containing protein [Oligoflexia bacterium]|nr:HEAT repeat domain-containing protein [Oligoflexia bacterium]HMP48704.1 HEAT repeat domain-containing protein [Oligoflexia bacterium]